MHPPQIRSFFRYLNEHEDVAVLTHTHTHTDGQYLADAAPVKPITVLESTIKNEMVATLVHSTMVLRRRDARRTNSELADASLRPSCK